MTVEHLKSKLRHVSKREKIGYVSAIAIILSSIILLANWIAFLPPGVHVWDVGYMNSIFDLHGDDSSVYAIGRISNGENDWDASVYKFGLNGSLLWSRTIGSNGTEVGNAIWSNGSQVYSLYFSNNFPDYHGKSVLVRLDPEGTVIWTRYINDTSTHHIHGDLWSDGTYLYTITTERNYSTAYDKYLLIAKWDWHGNVLWTQNATCGHAHENWLISGNGSVLYTCGEIGDTMLLAKWNSTGDLVWNKTHHGVPVGLWCNGSDVYTMASVGGINLTKWDADGNRMWSYRCCWDGFDYPQSLWVDGSSFLVGGMTSGDAFIIELNSSGQPVSNKTWGTDLNDRIYAIWGINGKIFTAGHSEMTSLQNGNLFIDWETLGDVSKNWIGPYTIGLLLLLSGFVLLPITYELNKWLNTRNNKPCKPMNSAFSEV